MKIKTYISFTIFFLNFFSFVFAHPPEYEIKTVVIDAGHGGHDVGCIGSSAQEKHIALDISLRLGAMIEKKFPQVKVIYTRKTDVFVELHERAAIANRAKADVFLCIHCNSACYRNPKTKKDICNEAINGTETYVMGLHKTEDNLSVSRRENSSVLLEKNYKTKYDGFDPGSAEANIIFSLFQNSYMHQSLLLASAIQTEFEQQAKRNNRGVKQAGFLVLYRTTMPSVLIETGFLTNRKEEKYLLSEHGQETVAAAIFKAFSSFKAQNENDLPDVIPPLPESGPSVEKHTDTMNKPGIKNYAIRQKDSLKISNDSAVSEKFISEKTQGEINTEKKNPISKTNIYYTVQIGAMPEGSKAGMERYEKTENVIKRTGEDGVIRFTIGNYQTMNEVLQMQSIMRAKGFKDAFVTAYNNEKRILLKEAAALLNN